MPGIFTYVWLMLMVNVGIYPWILLGYKHPQVCQMLEGICFQTLMPDGFWSSEAKYSKVGKLSTWMSQEVSSGL